MNALSSTLLLATFLPIATAQSQAQLINFETLPSGLAPTDGMAISNQFLGKFGVSFQYMNGTFPHIAKVGYPATAFWGHSNPSRDPDQPLGAQNVGTFFLTDDGVLSNSSPKPPPLLISYATGVAATSGAILDIDHNKDSWRIEARNIQNQVVATTNLGTHTPNTGTGLATHWSLSHSNAEIRSLLITYTGNGKHPGFAFDNFSPALPSAPAVMRVDLSQQTPGISVAGSFGSTYEVQFVNSLSSTTWQTFALVTLTNAPEQAVVDLRAPITGMRFYRAVNR